MLIEAPNAQLCVSLLRGVSKKTRVSTHDGPLTRPLCRASQIIMSTTSGLTRLYHPSDGALMHSIFALISPWDRSPYALRRVCRSFRAFYAVRVVWTRLLRDHFSAAAAVRFDMTLEEARHLCALALQEPWQELIKGQVLQQFRDSGWSILDLSRTNVTALPHRGHRELEHLTTLRLPLRCSLDSLPEDFAVLQNLTEESFMAAIKRVKTLPEDIVDHPHLRDATELDLSGSRLVTLPKRFGDLKNLKTLDLENCRALVSLPKGFGDLTNLATLYLDDAPAGRSMPAALKAQLEAQGCESSGNGW